MRSRAPEGDPDHFVSEDAQYVLLERLGIADDLGLDTPPGSEAWCIAVREARRVAAGIPGDLRRSREPNLLDVVLEKFSLLGDITCTSVTTPAENDEISLAISPTFEVRVDRLYVGS